MPSFSTYSTLIFSTSLKSCPGNGIYLIPNGSELLPEIGMSCPHWCGETSTTNMAQVALIRPFCKASQTSITSQVSGVNARTGCMCLLVLFHRKWCPMPGLSISCGWQAWMEGHLQGEVGSWPSASHWGFWLGVVYSDSVSKQGGSQHFRWGERKPRLKFK